MKQKRSYILLFLILTFGASRLMLAESVDQSGEYLSIAMNGGATLSDDTTALNFDRDGGGTLPPVQFLLPSSAMERFALSFTRSNQDYLLSNVAAPGVTELEFSIAETSTGDSFQIEAQQTYAGVNMEQNSSFEASGRILRLELRLTNVGSEAIDDLLYLRAANADIDLVHYGQAETYDQIVNSLTGGLAVSSGPGSGLALGLGVLEGETAAGFCYRCTDASTTLYDSNGRLEDWDLAVQVRLGSVEPQASVAFTVVYLAGESVDEVIESFEANLDADGDGYTGLDGDCDDARATRYPGAAELCDGLDNDCDGRVDEGTDCGDDDGDGYSENQGDCDDSNPDLSPAMPEGTDSDGDGNLEPDGIDNNCNGIVDDRTEVYDDDSDGYTELEGDCDDTSAAIKPGGQEVAYDGIDQDCDGADLVDADHDGYDAEVGDPDAGPFDCDDTSATRYPGADEVDNRLDDDCDELVDEGFIHAGAVIVTEILYDPVAVADREGEFIELYNTSDQSIDLHGWTLSNSAGQRHTFDKARGTTRVASRDFLLLGVNPDSSSNGALALDYPIGEFTLANGSDELELAIEDLVIDSASYDESGGYSAAAGASLQLDASSFSAGKNDEASAWCVSTSAWAEGTDLGSPGSSNSACPEPEGITDADGDGFDSISLGGKDCDDAEASIYPGADEIPYDGVDQDCDRYDLKDVDQDGYAAKAAGGGDCDDTDPSIHPDADEDGGGDGLSDGIDNDCDGKVDEGTLDLDDDGDGFTDQEGDCGDYDVTVYPGATEVRDGQDNDCDGIADNAWQDQDGDNYSPEEGDCDDEDSSVYPGAPEVADEKDQDCDQVIDEDTEVSDDDGDGVTELDGDCNDAFSEIRPGSLEVCGDGIDQDCDGEADEGCEGGGCSYLNGAGADARSRGGEILIALLLIFIERRRRGWMWRSL